MELTQHSLLGWHRGVVIEVDRVNQWLRERELAVMETLAQIPGGKNVAQYMKTNGWLDLGPQILAVKTEPLRTSDLNECAVISLRQSEIKGHTVKLAVGLLDRSLCVRALLIQTPDMHVAQGMGSNIPYAATLPLVTHPTCFLIGQRFTSQLNELSTRIEQHICLQTELWASSKRGWAPPTEMRGNDLMGEKKWLITRNEDYPRFDEHRRLIQGAQTIFRGARVRGLLFIPSVTVLCTHHGFGYFDVTFKRLIQQLMVLPRRKMKRQECLFTNNNE